MKKTLLTIIIFISLGTLISCGLTSIGDAQKIAESYLNERILTGELEGDKKYYSDIFLENSNEEERKKFKLVISKSLGNLKSYKLSTWNSQSKMHTDQLSGTFILFVYETEYDKGKGKESITMHKNLNAKTFKILSHKIDSPEIKKLIDQGIEKAIKEETSAVD